MNWKFWKKKEDKEIEKDHQIVVNQAYEIQTREKHRIEKIEKLEEENVRLKEEYTNLKNLNNVLIDSYWNPKKENELAQQLDMKNHEALEYKNRVRDNHVPDYSKNPLPEMINVDEEELNKIKPFVNEKLIAHIDKEVHNYNRLLPDYLKIYKDRKEPEEIEKE